MLSALLLSLPLTALDAGDDQYQFIVGLCDKGMHELAVKEASGFLRKHARHAKVELARYRLANSLFELGRTREAGESFRVLNDLESFEFAAEAAFRLGQCELEAKRYDPATRALRRTLQLNEEYLRIPATFLLGETHFRAGDYTRAEEHYRTVLEAKPPQENAAQNAAEYARDAAYGLAWCAFRTEDYERALRRIESFLSQHASSELAQEMHFLAGECHYESGRQREALAAYRKVEGGEYGDEAQRGVAFALAAIGDHRGAAVGFGRLLETYPESPFRAEAALHKGIHLLKAGDARAALEALKDPEVGRGPNALYWRAQAQLALEEPRAALAMLDRAARALEKQTAQEDGAELATKIQMSRGEALYALGRLDEAAEAYGSSGSDYALHAAAITSLNAGRTAEAERFASQFLEHFPDSPYLIQTRLALGEALFAQERYAEAEAAFAVVAAAAGSPISQTGAEPDAASRSRAMARVGWCRYLQGKAGAAAMSFARVVAEYPDSPEAADALFMQARALAQDGRAVEAQALFERYLERHREGVHRPGALVALAKMDPEPSGDERLHEVLREHADSSQAEFARFDLAERAARRGEGEAAREYYRSYLERHPAGTHVDSVRYGLAWSYYEAEDYLAAIELLLALTHPGSSVLNELRVSSLELLVWAQRKSGDARGALEAYRKFATACQDSARRFRAAQAAAGAMQEKGETAAAQGLLAELFEGEQDRQVRADILVEAIFLALGVGEVDLAEAQVSLAHEQKIVTPALAEACFFVGEARFDAGDDERAIALYQRAAEAPGSAVVDRALYKQGFAHLRGQDSARAAKCFGEFVREHPKSELYGEGLFLWGEALVREERYSEALAPLQRLLAELPEHESAAKARFRAGVALGRLERWADAERQLGDLIRRHPDFEHKAEAELWRGRALAARGERRGARSAFERVVAEDRGALAAQARIEMGRMHFEAGETEEALSEFLKVAVLYAQPEEVAEALLLAGHCLEKLGDPEQAARQYREILEKYPRTASVAAARARLEKLESE